MEPNMITDPEVLLENAKESVKELLEEKKYFDAKKELLEFNNADIAEILEDIMDDEDLIDMVIVTYRLLPKDVSVEVFAFMSPTGQLKIVDGITEKELTNIVKELDFDDKIDILEELPATLVDRLLEKAPKEERKLINAFLNYPDNCAGSLMTPEYVSLQENMTVAEAMAKIRRVGKDAETIYTCYVKDNSRRLLGIVSLSTLVTATEDTVVRDIMHTDYVWVNVYDDQEEVAEQFKKYDFLAIPVVDSEQRLVGIITVDDILDVQEEEFTEDFERMAGVIDFEDSTKGYLDVSVWQHAINRLPWLIILMIAYIFTGMIITNFENKLSEIICLVAYMPLLMGTGGNTGSQAATLIIRGLATDEVDTHDVLKILWKEIRIGLVIGIILSAFNFARVYWLDHNGLLVSLTVCLAMLVIVVFAKILGSMVPLLVKKLKLDPALIANPTISSISDAVALTIYFAVASLLLGL